MFESNLIISNARKSNKKRQSCSSLFDVYFTESNILIKIVLHLLWWEQIYPMNKWKNGKTNTSNISIVRVFFLQWNLIDGSMSYGFWMMIEDSWIVSLIKKKKFVLQKESIRIGQRAYRMQCCGLSSIL